MKFDRFDFEQQLLECWNITKDINGVTGTFNKVIVDSTKW